VNVPKKAQNAEEIKPNSEQKENVLHGTKRRFVRGTIKRPGGFARGWR
jgi:hypothetical protein